MTRGHPSSAWPAGLERGLRNYWYPVCRSEDVADRPTTLTRSCEPIAVWRDSSGVPRAVRDRCPHRGAALSVGRVRGDLIQCRYHGLVFDGAGQCRDIPSASDGPSLAKTVSVPAYETSEAGGAVWAFLGDTVAPPFEPPTWLVNPSMVGWWQAWRLRRELAARPGQQRRHQPRHVRPRSDVSLRSEPDDADSPHPRCGERDHRGDDERRPTGRHSARGPSARPTTPSRSTCQDAWSCGCGRRRLPGSPTTTEAKTPVWPLPTRTGRSAPIDAFSTCIPSTRTRRCS